MPKKGLTLSLWAKEPMVADPVALNFDDQGRLYVAETARRGTVDIDIRSHPDWVVDDLSNQSIDDLRRFFRTRMSPEKSAENARWLPDYNKDGSHDWRDLMGVKERIRLLEDPQHTGTATKSSVFYEGFNEEVTGVLAGVFPWGKDVFATVYPDLWRLRGPDTTSIDTTTSAESMFRGFGVHAAFDGHDLHGLVIGPDGKIYFSHGDNGFSTVNKEGKAIRKPNTGGIFRMNPDGSELELFAYGLRNVQEIAFDEFGNMFGVDNDGDLADERERFVYITEGSDSGWRLHWQFKEHGWQRQTHVPDYNPWINERMWVPLHPGQPAHITPPLSNYSVGPSGFKYNPGTGLNDEYHNSFFLAQFPVQKVTTFKVQPKGAGFEMVGEHVLLSGMMASAVNFGPDGAMYVADWDGMWNPDGKGAIWVLDDPKVAKSMIRQEVQRLLAEGMTARANAELIKLLAHADMRIRMRAQFELASRHESKLLLQTAKDASAPRLARIHALWGLGQLKDKQVASSLPFDDADAEIRTQSAKLAGTLHAAKVSPQLVKLLGDHDIRVQFHAVMALATAGREADIPAIVHLLETNNNADAFLRHACISALAGIGKAGPLHKLATHPSSAVRIGAVVALRRLGSPEVAAFLKDSDVNVRLEAVRAVHDDDGVPAVLPVLAASLETSRSDEPEAFTRRAIDAGLRLGHKEDADRLLRYALDTTRPEAMRAEALEALGSWERTPLIDRVEGMVRRTTPRPASEAGLGRSLIQANITKLFEVSGPVVAESIARALSDNSIPVDTKVLVSVLNSDSQKTSTRAQALKILAGTHPREASALIEQSLESPQPELRTVALELLATSDPGKLATTVSKRFEQFSLAEQQKALALAARMNDGLLDAFIKTKAGDLKEGKLPKELALDVLQAAAGRRMPIEKRAGEPVSAPGASSAKPKLTEALYGGDPKRGEDIFRNHVNAQCVRCHDAGGPGKQAGPVLKGVASRSTREYLLESVIDPGAKIAPGFENVTIALNDGDMIDGQKISEANGAITLRLPEGEIRTLTSAQIKSITTSTVSSMPSMTEILSPFEIRDVVAYLSELK